MAAKMIGSANYSKMSKEREGTIMNYRAQVWGEINTQPNALMRSKLDLNQTLKP